MRNKRFVILLVLGLIILSACVVQQTNEPIPTPEPTPEATPVPTPTPEPWPEIAREKLPDGEFMLKDLFLDTFTKIELIKTVDNGSFTIVVEDKDKIYEFLNAVGNVVITDAYEPIFLEAFFECTLSVYDGERKLFSFKDNNYLEILIENVKYKKGYAVKDEELRRNRVLIPQLEALFEDYDLVLNNGEYDIQFVPLHVEKDAYVITGELSSLAYAWPVLDIEKIDFSGYTLSIGENEITELPKEPGEYILVVESTDGKYQIKISVD